MSFQSKRLLVTGGAGYVGSILVPMLLEQGYQVWVVDALIFSERQSPISTLQHPNLTFSQGDLRQPEVIRRAVDNVDVIIHLAALVGEPACRRQATLTQAVNVDIVKQLNQIRAGKPLLLLSTSSVYSEFTRYERCTETTIVSPPAPTLVYARSKYQAEQIVAASDGWIILRPATAFGYSPRIRLDLLPNEFVFRALTDRQLELYNPYYMRTFVHVRDLARAIILMIEHIDERMGEIFNVGNNALNVTKKELADLIRTELDFTTTIVDGSTDPDQRNFLIDYKKITQLGFRTKLTLRDGIRELIKQFRGLAAEPSFYNTNYQLQSVEEMPWRST